MADADVIEGKQLEWALPRILAANNVAFVHLHNAKPGCYAAKVTRA
jgi:hypothetical protein